MEKKKLAEEYALKEYTRVNGENDLIFEGNRCFTFDDIKAAFNAGRESVLENIPELTWESSLKGIFSQTPIFKYFIELDDSIVGIKIIGNVTDNPELME